MPSGTPIKKKKIVAVKKSQPSAGRLTASKSTKTCVAIATTAAVITPISNNANSATAIATATAIADVPNYVNSNVISTCVGSLIYNAQEIYPGLWLGDINSALDKKFLQSKKITCIFNCTKSLPFIDDSRITSKFRIAVMDNLEPDEIMKMYKLINPTVNKLHSSLNDNNVLVHCHKGKQRSATIIIAYLMKFANMTKDEAMFTVKTKRPVICSPAPNFDFALDKYERDLKK